MQTTAHITRERSFLYFFTGIRGILAFPLLMSIAASVKIPLFFTPVPITLQTLALFFSMVCLKEKAGIAQFLYIVLGCFGFPSFAFQSFNLLYVAGPTGGYLLGFFIAAVIGGILLRRVNEATFFKLVFLFLFSTAIVYLCGIAWMMAGLRIRLAQALVLGVYPFIAGDFLKIAIAALSSVRLMNALKTPRGH